MLKCHLHSFGCGWGTNKLFKDRFSGGCGKDFRVWKMTLSMWKKKNGYILISLKNKRAI